MTGCVIPVAPHFEDEPNYPPFIVESRPLVGEEIQGPPGGMAEFAVTLGDPNVQDVLYVRWSFDYPKYTSTSRLANSDPILLPGGSVVRAQVRFRPDCLLHSIARGITQHRLLLVASDRAFITQDVPPDTPLDVVPEDARRVHAVWLLNMECK
jgi:hypothetical protein